MNELLEKGLKVVPVTIWDDEVVIGFNPKELSRLFDLSSEDSFEADLPEMISKFEIILTAAGKATRQIPEDKLPWESPERERTLAQFVFHLFDISFGINFFKFQTRIVESFEPVAAYFLIMYYLKFCSGFTCLD